MRPESLVAASPPVVAIAARLGRVGERVRVHQDRDRAQLYADSSAATEAPRCSNVDAERKGRGLPVAMAVNSVERKRDRGRRAGTGGGGGAREEPLTRRSDTDEHNVDRQRATQLSTARNRIQTDGHASTLQALPQIKPPAKPRRGTVRIAADTRQLPDISHNALRQIAVLALR